MLAGEVRAGGDGLLKHRRPQGIDERDGLVKGIGLDHFCAYDHHRVLGLQ